MKVFHVDAFTSIPFRGNPAAVCILDEEHDNKWMQAVASEMNLSETAFLLKRSDGYNLRWFTPVTEVDLCGHATLASAHVLWEKNCLNPDQEVHFYTKSGLLTAHKQGSWIELNFPVQRPRETEPPKDLLEALAVSPLYVGKNAWDYLIEVEHEDILRTIQPDFNTLSRVDMRGVIVTCRATECDFVSRFFAPAVGVNEDPVNGSAHCCLAPYWSNRLKKESFLAYQASLRGGKLKVRIQGERVYISGEAITIFTGKLTV